MIKDLSLDDLLKLANVLHDIGQLAFYTKEDEAIVYPSEDNLNSPPSSNTLSAEERRFFVFAIQEEKAVKILHEHTFGRREKPYRWTLEVDKPRLRELESEVKQIYLGTSNEKKHKGQMFETGGGGGYYNRNHPINPPKKLSANEIVDGFSSSNYAFVLMVVKGILSASEFGTDGEVNYRLQSAPGQMLMQERQLLSKFEKLGLFRNLGEDGIFGIATLNDVDLSLLRQIIAEIEERESGVISENKFEEIKKRYNKTIQGLRERNQSSELKERYNKALEEIKSEAISLITPQRPDVQEQNKPLEVEIGLTDTSSRRAYEKKWDVLQAIWDVYESHSRPDSILVPVARLAIKGRAAELIDGIIDGLKKEGLFKNWDRQDRWYNLEFINHEKLPNRYEEVGKTYKKFATTYQERNKNDAAVKNQPSQIIVSFDDKKPAIIINEKEVKIPYGTNQYNLCKAVFGKTKKRWENDELLDKFGANIEEIKVKRQPYDAMLAINKKVKQESGIDNLILCESKTFRLNPKYLP